MSSDEERLLALARRYVWWGEAEYTLTHNRHRLIAQVMEMGTWEDAHALLAIVGRDAFVAVLQAPPAGALTARSWAFWHRRLGLGEPPPLPVGRRLPAVDVVGGVHS